MARKAAKKRKKAKTAKKAAPSAKRAKAAPSKKSTSRPKTAEMIADVRELVDLMTANDITEVHMENGQTKIVLRRGGSVEPDISIPALAPPAAGAPAAEADQDAEKDNLIEIVSPMVGTFYSSPSPDSDAYVAVGADITDDTVVCILEAMKVMNEIKAECCGTIAEVCVSNAQPVEFGQVLFRVQPV